MCGTCGCDGGKREPGPDHEDHHGHAHEHGHEHPHGTDVPPATRTLRLEAELLEENRRIAQENRARWAARGIVAVNVMGGPGAGKTSLLEGTLGALREPRTVAVLEGDQETSRDADRIRRAGGEVLQLNTGACCHLDARMIREGVQALRLRGPALLLIENVGNLVCPSLFDLGERIRVVVSSVPEGDDKPGKYPHMFRAANVVVLNKIDLLPHVRFDVERFFEDARAINPRAGGVRLSATEGGGMDAWCRWLQGASA